ncbi:hypothetical protein KCU77_g1299, partial [Aureobasidium melanogenum]
MASNIESKKRNRVAQAEYRKRQKSCEEHLELEVKKSKERFDHLRRLEQISRERINAEAPGQSTEPVPPTVSGGRSRTPDPEAQPSEIFSGTKHVSQELFAPDLSNPCDLSPLFPQVSSHSDSDLFAGWESDEGGFFRSTQDVADDPKTVVPLDRLQVDLEAHDDAVAGHADQVSRDIPSQDTLPVAKSGADTTHGALESEGTAQESKYGTLENNAGLGYWCPRDSSLSTVNMDYMPCIDATVPYAGTGTGLTTWSGFRPSDFTFNPHQATVQQVVYIFQNSILFPNNLMGYAFDSTLRPLLI